jgi:hypothetical protein
MVMKNVGGKTNTVSSSQETGGELKMEVDNDEFWESVKKVIGEKFKGGQDKDEVFAALKKGFHDKFEVA